MQDTFCCLITLYKTLHYHNLRCTSLRAVASYFCLSFVAMFRFSKPKTVLMLFNEKNPSAIDNIDCQILYKQSKTISFTSKCTLKLEVKCFEAEATSKKLSKQKLAQMVMNYFSLQFQNDADNIFGHSPSFGNDNFCVDTYLLLYTENEIYSIIVWLNYKTAK